MLALLFIWVVVDALSNAGNMAELFGDANGENVFVNKLCITFLFYKHLYLL